MKFTLIIIFSFIMAGCADSNTSNSANNDIHIYNLEIVDSSGPVTSIDRSSSIRVRAILANDSEAFFSGYYGITIFVTCEGRNPWELYELTLLELAAGDSVSYTVGRSCSDLPQEKVNVVVTIYGPDQEEVIDTANYEFDLI